MASEAREKAVAAGAMSAHGGAFDDAEFEVGLEHHVPLGGRDIEVAALEADAFAGLLHRRRTSGRRPGLRRLPDAWLLRADPRGAAQHPGPSPSPDSPW